MAPGFALTLAVLVGVATGVTMPAAAPVACLATALALASLALLPERRAWRAWLGVAALACLSGAHGATARDRALAPPIAGWFETVAGPDDRARELVIVEGRLREDAAQVPGGVRLQIDVAAVRDAGWQASRTGPRAGARGRRARRGRAHRGGRPAGRSGRRSCFAGRS